MALRRYASQFLLLLVLSLLLASCGDSEDAGDLKPPEDADGIKPPEDDQAYPPSAYSPFVIGVEVTAGEGYIDVLIEGVISSIADFISDVQVIRLPREILLIPIADSPPIPTPTAVGPFEKAVRIEGLKPGHHAITIMTSDPVTGERGVVTKLVEVK